MLVAIYVGMLMLRFWQKLRNFCGSAYPYVLEEVDLHRRIVVVRCSGTRTVIRFRFNSLFNNMSVISGLSPNQSSLLGGYYGRALSVKHEKYGTFKQAKNINFLLSNSHGRYKITLQNRDGSVSYYDQKTHQEFIEHPLTIVSNNYVISEFDSSQACYLGILAGISMEKAISREEKTGKSVLKELLDKPPLLRVVK